MKMMREEVPSRPEVRVAINRILQKTSAKKGEALPLINVSTFDYKRLTLSFFLVSQDQPGLGSFFFEMITRSIPGRVSLFFLSSDEGDLLMAELEVTFDHLEQWESIRGSIEVIRQELLVGMRSPYHANRILELKGMSVEKKRIRVQERVAKTIHRFPNRFDYDFFSLVQHYFIRAHQESFRFHEARQISENLSGLYLLRKKLVSSVERQPDRRHLFVKLRKRRLHLPLGTKEVLGVFVGLNFLKEHEVFSKKHLLRAIQSLIPNVKHFEESAYLYRDSELPLLLVYMEIDSTQKQLLQKELPFVLKGRVEHLQRPLFMPQNEEEVMRHIITLGGQLNFFRDLPQVIISFHEQTDTKLYFTVILARVLLPFLQKPAELLGKFSHLCPNLERLKTIGKIRKKYFKEALVFKVELSLIEFLRDDQSVALYAARSYVLGELEKVVGEVRDYNGGMISKQNEVRSALHELLGVSATRHRLLLDNFFYALFPVEKRSLIEPYKLKTLFSLLLEVFEGKKMFLTSQEKDVFYLLIETQQRETLLQFVRQMEFSSRPVSLELFHDDRFFFGLILEEKEAEKAQSLKQFSSSSF